MKPEDESAFPNKTLDCSCQEGGRENFERIISRQTPEKKEPLKKQIISISSKKNIHVRRADVKRKIARLSLLSFQSKLIRLPNK
jgi:hypothetical protein